MGCDGGIIIVEYRDIQENWNQILENAKSNKFNKLFKIFSSLEIENTTIEEFCELLRNKGFKCCDTPYAYKGGVIFSYGDNVEDSIHRVIHLFSWWKDEQYINLKNYIETWT